MSGDCCWPASPGPVPSYPPWNAWGADDNAAWRAYVARSDGYWRHLARELGRHVPCDGLEYIGGGEVIRVVYEDRSYAWLGGRERGDCDGPYAWGHPALVGGYRYRGLEGDQGDVYTDVLMLEVEDPDDGPAVARRLAEAARLLWAMPFTEGPQ